MDKTTRELQIGVAYRGSADETLRRTFTFRGYSGVLVRNAHCWSIESTDAPPEVLAPLREMLPVAIRAKTQEEHRKRQGTDLSTLSVQVVFKVTPECWCRMLAQRQPEESIQQALRRVLNRGLDAATSNEKG